MDELVITAHGHLNVQSLHKSTLEFTKETHLSLRGDCIVAIGADKGMLDMPESFKDALRKEGSKVEISISCEGLEEKVTAYGHPQLILTHPTDWVVRTSEFICPRTLAIRSDKAAKDLDRKMIDLLKKGSIAKIKMVID